VRLSFYVGSKDTKLAKVKNLGAFAESKILKKISRRQTLIAYLLLAPFLILALLFFFYPFVQAVQVSFYRVKLPQDVFIGYKNYLRLFFGDETFYVVLRNTLIYGAMCVGGVCFAILPGLFIASNYLTARPRLKKSFQMTISWTFITSWVVLGTAWNWVFLVGAGSQYAGRGLLAISPLGNTDTVVPTVGLIFIWAGVGFNALLFLAGLKAVPKEIFEAAHVDGASGWQMTRYITVPATKPILVFLIVNGFIWSFQAYEPVATLTDGGPGWASSSTVHYMVRQAMYGLDFGYAAAMGLIVAVIVLVLSVMQFRFIYGRFV
jgi:multiple sugar transport system permease protein